MTLIGSCSTARKFASVVVLGCECLRESLTSFCRSKQIAEGPPIMDVTGLFRFYGGVVCASSAGSSSGRFSSLIRR
jgi:hypothetical protein